LEICAALLQAAEHAEVAEALLRGFDEAFRGQLASNLPSSLVDALAKHRGESLEWKLQQGDLSVLPELHEQLLRSTEAAQQIAWLELLGQTGDPSSLPVIREVVDRVPSLEVRTAAYQALRGFATDDIARQAIQKYGSAADDERRLIEGLLASRPGWTELFLAAIEAGDVDKAHVAAQAIDQMSFHSSQQIQESIRQIWGARETTSQEELDRRIEHLQEVLSVGSGNPYQGRTLYNEHCGRCHKLFNQGGDIGPDLTSYQRTDPYRMLANVLSPSLEIREGYETNVVLTIDGLTVSGFIADQDPRQVTIRQADGQSVIIPKDDIEELTAVPKSVMPEGLLDELSDEALRNLFAYLRSTLPLPD
jgi:putative heme-binding domain-containing protein